MEAAPRPNRAQQPILTPAGYRALADIIVAPLVDA